jgi:hypothetical protein
MLVDLLSKAFSSKDSGKLYFVGFLLSEYLPPSTKMSTTQYPQKDGDTNGYRYGPLSIAGVVRSPSPSPTPTAQLSRSPADPYTGLHCSVWVDFFLNPDAIYLGYMYEHTFLDFPLKDTTLAKFRERLELGGRNGIMMEKTEPIGFDRSQLKLDNVWVRADVPKAPGTRRRYWQDTPIQDDAELLTVLSWLDRGLDPTMRFVAFVD